MAVTLNANTSTGFIATSDTSGVLQLQTAGTAAVTVDASQNVGIGTASPGYKLHVSNYMALGTQASAGAGAGISMIPSSTLTNWFVGANYVNAGTFQIIPSTAGGGSTFTTPALTVDSSGNVGIGTSSPTVKLDVAGFSKGAIVHRSGSYTNGATTPSVSGATYFVISNSSPTTITNFTNAEDGQIIYLYFGNSNTTIDRSNCYLAGGVNFVSTAADVLVLLKSGSYWFEVSRSVNS